jgi:23S rRNA (adenine2503-C2)-methyltransferase
VTRCALGLTAEDLRAAFLEQGLEGYRGMQVFRWLHARGVRDFEAMTDLGREQRRVLADHWSTRALVCVEVRVSRDGTRKLELETGDGARIEAVLIPDGGRRTLCVSSQVGCGLDCSFCATGRLGFGRNLDAAEIVDQVAIARDVLAEAGERLTHVVFMGMGEPLLNLANVAAAIRVLTHGDGLALAPRRITVSTAGLVPRIAALAEVAPVRLAISLHATTDEVRNELVPINRRFPLAELLEACRKFPATRRDPLSFEYTLIAGVNDAPADARRLSALLRGLCAKVNLIPMNEHPGAPYRRPPQERIDAFAREARRSGLAVTVRRPRGDDIFAACGQLGQLGPGMMRDSSAIDVDR